MPANGTVLTVLDTGDPTGLKFTVEHGGARALFEFGRAHSPGRQPFSQGLAPRAGHVLADLVRMGEAPALDGVYQEWDGRTEVFVSHLHLDHSGLVEHLHPDVPLHYPAEMEPLRAAADAVEHPRWRSRPGRPAADGESVRVGEIEVKFVAVDHDLPGASGFLVRTPDLSLAYTGDHRWHGSRPERTAGFAAAARGADVLLQEGVGLRPAADADALTEYDPERVLPEPAVEAVFAEVAASTRGLLVANLYAMNRERVEALGRACAASGRRLLLEPDAARLAGWDGVLDDLDPVRRDPAGHAVMLGFTALPCLIDLDPPPGSAYLHSNGLPIGPYDPDWGVLRSWLDRLGLTAHYVHSSGHSTPGGVQRMVEAVRPGVVLPVHSRAPEALDVPGVPRVLPEPLRPYPAAELLAAAGR